MKPAAFLTLLLIVGCCGQIPAQTNVGVFTTRRPGTPTQGDTIGRGQGVCLDTTVISFVVTVVYRGAITERKYAGNCSGPLHTTSGGAKIFCSEIISQPQPGVNVRLPPRTFYVR